MTYLFQATVRIEQGLVTLVKNQESLERIIEMKFHDLDVKVTELATDFGKLKEDFDARVHSDSDEQTTLCCSVTLSVYHHNCSVRKRSMGSGRGSCEFQ
jgi:hypothetical protein